MITKYLINVGQAVNAGHAGCVDYAVYAVHAIHAGLVAHEGRVDYAVHAGHASCVGHTDKLAMQMIKVIEAIQIIQGIHFMQVMPNIKESSFLYGLLSILVV